MAIYSLHHQPIGKSTQARPHTSAAHVRYITRPSAASRIEARRMPDKPGRAAAFMVDGENADRKNARVSDKLMLALPRELDAGQRAQLVRDFAEEVTQGRASWLAAFHDQGKDAHNPHAHLIIRDRDPATGKRVAGLSEKGSTDRLRALWEGHANRALEKAGRAERIDRRTLEAQGIERPATVHEGPRAQQMDRRGARPESRMRRYRNRPGSHLPHREVDYRGIDRGRSRPGYNRLVRQPESPADYWEVLDADTQRRELEQLRQIHHPPESVILFPARGAGSHGNVGQHGINPGMLGRNLAGVRLPELPQEGLFSPRVPRHISLETAPEGVGRPAGHQKILQPPKGTVEEPAKPVEQDILHKRIIGNKNLSGKGNEMSVDDDDRKLREADLAHARAQEGKSRAARDNALEKGYMRPELAKKSIGNYYNDHGEAKLREKFGEFAGPSEFGVKRGNPLTKEGRANRREANAARRDIPGLWAAHDRDAKNLAAAERSYRDKYGTPQPSPAEGQGVPTPQPGGKSASPASPGAGQAQPSGTWPPREFHENNPFSTVPQERHPLSLRNTAPGKPAPEAGMKPPAQAPQPERHPLSLRSPAPPKAPGTPPVSPQQALGREAMKTPIGKEPVRQRRKGLDEGR